ARASIPAPIGRFSPMTDLAPRAPARSLQAQRRNHDRLSATSSERAPAAPPRIRNVPYWRVFDNDDLHVRSEAPSRRAPASALGRPRTRRRAPAEARRQRLARPRPGAADAGGRAGPDRPQAPDGNPG